MASRDQHLPSVRW
ncbi:hypothetical protein LINPERPRIM_LOCUS39126 [Linum perenne]